MSTKESNLDYKDKMIREQGQIIASLTREIELKVAGHYRIVLPHNLAILIYELVKNNNCLYRSSAFIVNHDGHRVTSIEKLI